MARPLTRKKKKTGELYIRPRDVEAEIDSTLALGLAEALRRSKVMDRASRRYLRSECLVHLVREAKRMGRDRESEAFLLRLLGRCEANLLTTIRQDGIPNPEQLRDDILQHLAMMFAQDAIEGAGRLDYFECRFNRAFATLRIDFYNREVGLVNRSASDTQGTDEEIAEDGDVREMSDSEFWGMSRLESRVFTKQVVAFLNALPPDEREVVVLCRIMKLTQEKAAQLRMVSVKTIYNRLTRADIKLARIKEKAR